MKLIRNGPNKHVFVCVNERDGECCKDVKGQQIFLELKKWVIETGLANSVFVTKTGCLGFCNSIGATVVVYPDQVWLMQTTLNDVEKVKEIVLEGL